MSASDFCTRVERPLLAEAVLRRAAADFLLEVIQAS